MTDHSSPALDSLMRDVAWAVHDFQRLAYSVSLLVSSIAPMDELDAPSFYTDIDTLTDPSLSSASGRRVAETLTDDDRRALRALKGSRDDLVYRFFLTHRLGDDGSLPDGAAEKVAELRSQVRNGQGVLNRLLASVSAAG